MTAGIRSIGWWVPKSRPAAGDDDHPSTMGARATRAALDAAGFAAEDLDLVITAGVNKDWPPPWVAALGVLHELGSRRAVGFDMSTRWPAAIDALWVARSLVESGTYRNVAVCCAERFDHLLRPQRGPEGATDGIHGAGAAAAVVSRDAANRIAAYSNVCNPDLSSHEASVPIAAGSRRPLDQAAVQEGLHGCRGQLATRNVDEIPRYSVDADRHDDAALFRHAGIDGVDLASCSPVYPEPQLRVLEEIGASSDSTLFTIPHLGHIDSADLLLILGVAIASGRRVGRRIVLSMRTSLYSNALAIVADGDEPGIAVAGQGIDLGLLH